MYVTGKQMECTRLCKYSQMFMIYMICIMKWKEFENTKGVIRIRKSKDRQHNGQKKKDKRIKYDLQNIHIKLKIEQHEPH